MTIKISKRKLCKALNTTETKKEAAELLNISISSLYARISSYELQESFKKIKKTRGREKVIISEDEIIEALNNSSSRIEAAKLLKISICTLNKRISLFKVHHSFKKKAVSESDKKISRLFNKIGTILIKQSHENAIFNKCKKIGIKNNAVLLSIKGKGDSRILKFKKDGMELEILYSYLRNNGFPKDIHNFLYKQEIKKSDNASHLERLRLRLEKEGATLLTTEWQGYKFPYQYLDYKGNIRTMSNSCFIPIKASINHTKNDIYYLNSLNLIALKNGGKLLSTKWEGSYSKYFFEDKFGEVFSSSYYNIKSGHWHVMKDENGNRIRHTWRKQASLEVERFNRIHAN